MNEVQYENMMEQISIGEHCSDCMIKIMDHYSVKNLAELMECGYDNPDIDIYLCFQLWNGVILYPDDPESRDQDYNSQVSSIGFYYLIDSDDCEGSYTIWLDLIEIDDPGESFKKFNEMINKIIKLANP